jgi:hypothetical protein
MADNNERQITPIYCRNSTTLDSLFFIIPAKVRFFLEKIDI